MGKVTASYVRNTISDIFIFYNILHLSGKSAGCMNRRDPLKMLMMVGGLILAVTLAHSAIIGA